MIMCFSSEEMHVSSVKLCKFTRIIKKTGICYIKSQSFQKKNITLQKDLINRFQNSGLKFKAKAMDFKPKQNVLNNDGEKQEPNMEKNYGRHRGCHRVGHTVVAAA